MQLSTVTEQAVQNRIHNKNMHSTRLYKILDTKAEMLMTLQRFHT